MSETKKTWFTKTIARGTVQDTALELFNKGEITSDVKAILDGLFEGKTTVLNTMVRNSDGEIVFKRCSYFGVYMDINEFGTVGKDEQGNVKYSHQSKQGAAATRKAKSKLEKAINEADEQLEIDEDVSAWKEAKSAAVAASDEKVEFDGESFATFEEATAAL